MLRVPVLMPTTPGSASSVLVFFTVPAPGSLTDFFATISAITGFASAFSREGDEGRGSRLVGLGVAARVGDGDALETVIGEPLVRRGGVDRIRRPQLAGEPIGVVVRRADQHPLQKLVLR